jgi:hypothetical protein
VAKGNRPVLPDPKPAVEDELLILPAVKPSRQGVVEKLLSLAKTGATAETLVAGVIAHHTDRHKPTHKNPPLITARTTLTRLKQALVKTGEYPTTFTDDIRLTKEQYKKCKFQDATRKRALGMRLTVFNGDDVVRDCRKWLVHPDSPIQLKVIALACLTGRRTAEIVCSKTLFGPPEEPDGHLTDLAYWASIRGFAKKKGSEWSRDVPLLAPRTVVMNAIKEVRNAWGLVCDSHSDVNKKYGKKISRAVQKYCPLIKNIHRFRHFYIAMCEHYFNQNSCAITIIAEDYLGHRGQKNVTAYLSMRISPQTLGGLDFKVNGSEKYPAMAKAQVGKPVLPSQFLLPIAPAAPLPAAVLPGVLVPKAKKTSGQATVRSKPKPPAQSRARAQLVARARSLSQSLGQSQLPALSHPAPRRTANHRDSR